uniref:Vesicle transport protein USE1 n=1 Tax=Opuntia streptacantha TaxID=393608 RepID=A0A7C9D622_OPUST
MGISKTEINLRRLLAAAPQQQNQRKLIHYVATLRELLEQLSEETTPEGLPRVSKAMVNDYSEKIESIASRLASPVDLFVDTSTKESPRAIEEEKISSPPGLRKRSVFLSSGEDKGRDNIGADSSPLVKLDAAAQSHIEKHRKLQEDLTDEMVGLAQQLKQSSLLMSQSLKNTEKILDSTEKAVEHSLASTGHANVRAVQVFSESSKTSCFTWLLMFVMTCVFMMVVLLIRVT